MRQRTITGLILLAILFPLIFLPIAAFSAVVGLFALIGAWEFFRMVRKKETVPRAFFVLSVLATLAIYASILLSFHGFIDFYWLLVVLIATMVVYLTVIVFDTEFSFEMLTKLFFGTLYIGIPFAAISIVHSMGIAVLFYMLALAMLTDVFAYLVGSTIGRHKLAPRVSPNKTVEGSIGGAVIAVAFATTFALYMNLFELEGQFFPILLLVFMGLIISFVAQIGDLIASAFKRNHGIKDFSNLLPGHGGILDRFDSTLFAAMVFSIFILILEGI